MLFSSLKYAYPETNWIKNWIKQELCQAQRTLYKVSLTAADGSSYQVSPAALADLGDADNNHFLCLDTTTPATAVAFPAGHLVDPNGDLNTESKVMVHR